MNRDCEVCGGEGDGILCPKCGKLVCHNCFDEEERMCTECLEKKNEGDATRRRLTLIGGILLLITGLSATAAGIVLGLPTKGIIIAFPFIGGEVSAASAATYSFLFFMTVACASLLPWIIHTSRGHDMENQFDYTIYEEQMAGNDGFEHTEYLITTELPRKLERTIQIETHPQDIHIWSTVDSNFTRSYPIPEGHDLEGLDYDYEDGYLVLRLHLVRIP